MWWPHSTHVTQWCVPPPLTSTVKSSLFMPVHSSPLSLAGLFLDRPHIYVCVFVFVYHIFFTSCLWTGTGYLQMLTSVNNATVNMGMQTFLWDGDFTYRAFAYIYAAVGLVDYIIVLLLTFWGVAMRFSIKAIPIYIPINSVKEFMFSTSWPNLPFGFFIITKRDEVVSHCGFDLQFPDN